MKKAQKLAVLFASCLIFSAGLATESLATPAITGPERDWREVIPAISPVSPSAQIQIRNAKLTVKPGMSLIAEDLRASLRPLGPDGIARLERLGQLQVNVHSASLLLDEAVLLKVVREELARIKAPLRIESVSVLAGQGLLIGGRILRHGNWVPFELMGSPEPIGGAVLRLSPKQMRIKGVEAVPLLEAADVHFDEIFKLKSEAFKVDKRDLVLNSAVLLPEPLLDYSLASLEFLEGAVRVRIASPAAAKAEVAERSPGSAVRQSGSPPLIDCSKVSCPDSFMFMEGGRLAAFGMLMEGSPTLMSRRGSEPLSLSLAHIEPLVAHSLVRIREGGALWVQTPLSGPEDLPAAGQPPLGADSLDALLASLNGLDAQPAGDTLFAVKDSAILTPAGVQVEVRSLIAQSSGSSLEELPFIEQQVLAAQLELTDDSLEKLLNRITFFYKDSPVRKVQVVQDADRMRIKMEVKPRLGPLPLIWTPIEMTGGFEIAQKPGSLNFVPDWIEAWGISVGPLLKGLGMQLDDLLEVDRPDVQLLGDVLTLNLNRALPPLTIRTLVHGVERVFGQPFWGLRMQAGTLDSNSSEPLLAKLDALPAGLWLNAPSLQAFGLTLGNTRAHVSAQGSDLLVMDLARYPQVLTQAVLQMPATGWVTVKVSAGQ